MRVLVGVYWERRERVTGTAGGNKGDIPAIMRVYGNYYNNALPTYIPASYRIR